ncbi:MAG: MerR family transcriptional regulator [Flavobacteriales bacterium]
MKQEFSIKDLENLTGVKAHTIRVWEQRYDLLRPERSETNIRTYSGDDLKRLLNVSLLVDRGLKISKVATMSEVEMLTAVQRGPAIGDQGEEMVAQQRLKVAMMSYDEQLFRDTMDECIDRLGFETTVLRVCLPFLAEVGVLWLTNAICPANEHFMSNLFRQMLYAQVHQTPIPKDEGQEVVVLYLPEREIHDISLLFVHQLCRAHGRKSVFLGQSVPFDDLRAVAGQFDKVCFVTYCTTYPAEGQAQEYVDRVVRTFEGTGISFHLAGGVFRDAKPAPGVTVDLTGGALVQRLF